MTFDPSTLSSAVLILAGFAAAFAVALWVSLIIWTFRDIRTRTKDPLLRILAALLPAVLFVPGVLIYLILRPQRTFEEEYQHTLEEEAMLQAIEDNPLCPGCSRRVQAGWTVCPNCHTKLRKKCQTCGQMMELPWNLCPFCGTPIPGMRRDNDSMEEALRSLPVEPGGP